MAAAVAAATAPAAAALSFQITRLQNSGTT